MGPVNARPEQDVRINHSEQNREEIPGRFSTTRAPTRQHVKMFKQVRAPPDHLKERACPETVTQGVDTERYVELKFRIGETVFAAHDKAEMRRAKIRVIASPDFLHTSKSLFWPDVKMLTGTDLDWVQPSSMAIGVQRQNEMNPIIIFFAGNRDHLHSRGLLSRLREPTTAEDAVWQPIKDNLESNLRSHGHVKGRRIPERQNQCSCCLRDMHTLRMD